MKCIELPHFFHWGGSCFSNPTSPPRSPIGSVPRVPSYTLSSLAFKGVTHGMSFKHTFPPLCYPWYMQQTFVAVDTTYFSWKIFLENFFTTLLYIWSQNNKSKFKTAQSSKFLMLVRSPGQGKNNKPWMDQIAPVHPAPHIFKVFSQFWWLFKFVVYLFFTF